MSRPISSRSGLLLPFVAAALLLTACATGERPYFSNGATFPTGVPTGDAAIDAVLERLDNVSTGPATAAYDVLQKFGNTHKPAVVALSPGKRSITVGTVHYIQTETIAVTCTTDNSLPCSDGFDPQRISDSGVTFDFYAASAATKLRRLADSKIGPATASTETIGGVGATCVTVPVTGGAPVFCVLDNGILAKQDDASVLVVLELYGDTADPNSFIPPA